MNLTQKTMKAGVWQLISIVVKVAIQLCVIAILARHILPEEFGLIALANMVLVFVEMFAEAGIGPAIIQKKDLRGEHIRAGFMLAVTLGILFVTVLWLIAPLLAMYFKSEALADIIRWLGLSVFIIKFGIISRSLIERDMHFHTLMWIDVGSYIFGYATVGITMAIMGYGVWAIVAAKLAQCCLQTIGLFALRPHSIKPVFSTSAYKRIAVYGGGLTLARFFGSIASQGDIFVVGRFCGISLLGFYERAVSVMVIPGQYMGYLLDKILFPAMSQIQDQSKRLENAYLMAIGLVNLILFPLSVLMFVAAPEIILVLLGPGWEQAVLPLQILLVTLNLRISVNLSDTLVRAMGAVYASAKRKAIFAFIMIFGSWIGHYWGIIGVAIAVNVAVIINCALMTQLSIKLVKGDVRNYFSGFKHSYMIGGILFLFSSLFAGFLRLHTDSAVVILFATIICSSIFLIVTILLFPKILGKPGQWLVRQVLEISPWKPSLSRHLTALRKTKKNELFF